MRESCANLDDRSSGDGGIDRGEIATGVVVETAVLQPHVRAFDEFHMQPFRIEAGQIRRFPGPHGADHPRRGVEAAGG